MGSGSGWGVRRVACWEMGDCDPAPPVWPPLCPFSSPWACCGTHGQHSWPLTFNPSEFAANALNFSVIISSSLHLLFCFFYLFYLLLLYHYSAKCLKTNSSVLIYSFLFFHPYETPGHAWIFFFNNVHKRLFILLISRWSLFTCSWHAAALSKYGHHLKEHAQRSPN